MSVPDYRLIPSIEQLRRRPGVTALEQRHGAAATTAALRTAAAAIRLAIATGQGSPSTAAEAADAIEREAFSQLDDEFRGSLRPVINATGVILHTNLGRAPLPASAAYRIAAVASAYSNLEYDLAAGSRGSRHVHAEALLTTLTGAEAGVVVNNNAAATLLVLAALAAGREVVVSRGELVEIGGGFRIPDVMAQSGAIIREVGTTNRTRLHDYTVAVGGATAFILRVHRSNFRVEGFVEQPALGDLVAAARALNVPLVEDLGSGCLLSGLADEPSVQASVEAGVDVICFSGDKLLGGPQAGLIVGRSELIDPLRRHPLMRALRVDKLTLAALEATLIEYRAGRAERTVPVLRMIQLPVSAIEERARALSARLSAAGWRVALMSGSSAIGGGSAPGIVLATVLAAIERDGYSSDALAARLRSLDPPIVARIEHDRVVLDLRTVSEEDDERLATAILSVT
jgi:L-seryl-tRNA(Ser) seleniumtransferase